MEEQETENGTQGTGNGERGMGINDRFFFFSWK